MNEPSNVFFPIGKNILYIYKYQDCKTKEEKYINNVADDKEYREFQTQTMQITISILNEKGKIQRTFKLLMVLLAN